MNILDWFVDVDLAKHGHDLAHAVGAVVEEEGRIAVLDTSLVAIDDDRLQKFVGLVLGISLVDRLEDIVSLVALSIHDCLDSNLDALPSLVTVHGIVPSDDGSKFTVILRLEELEQVFGIPFGRSGCSVATVAKEVYLS